MQSLSHYLETTGGIAALRLRYGTDKTFVVPILNNLAIAGLVPWSDVAALPFEAAVFPQAMYRFLGMPVVSYAVPALVAIGQAKFRRSGCWPPWSWVRQAAITPSLKVLEKMQPGSGGYLEATPLTAFVVMSLVDTQVTSPSSTAKTTACHRVVEQGLQFLENSVDADGSWPIDTNLATWVTSLSAARWQPTRPIIASGRATRSSIGCSPANTRCDIRSQVPNRAVGDGPICPVRFPTRTILPLR